MHATPRRKPSLRWLWAILSVVAVAALTIGAIRLQEGACAAVLPTAPTTPAEPQPSQSPQAPPAPQGRQAPKQPPAARGPDVAGRGTAVFHRDWSVVLCSMGPLPADGLYVSLSATEFAGAAPCGSYLEVGGPEGTVRAMVVDRCRGCGPGRLDLSERAFSRIAGGTGRGVVPVRYRQVRDPVPPERLAFRVKSGSSASWLGLLVTGHGNALSRVELRSGRDWRSLRRNIDNYWIVSGAGPGPFTVRVTDRYGNRAVAERIALRPGTPQRSGSRMYQQPARPETRARTPTPAPAPPSASTLPAPARPSATRSTPASQSERCA